MENDDARGYCLLLRARVKMREAIKKYSREIIAAGIIIGFAICIVVVSSVSSKKKKYNDAVDLIEQGKYDEGFSLMSKVKDADEVNEYKYSKAKEAYDHKNYSVAIKLFLEIKDYKDSSNMVNLCHEGEKELLYVQSEELYKSMSYESAMEGFLSLGDYRSAKDYVQKCKDGINDQKLSVAKNYFESENYDLALKTLSELNGYKDSQELINEINKIYETRYNEANEKKQSGDYEGAISIYTSIIDYKESRSLIGECEGKIKEIKYDEAVSYYNKNYYQEALTRFEDLSGFKDSDANVLQCKLNLLNVGDVFSFGQFEQDNNTGNGNEKINWIVLKKEANKVLLLSEKVLDVQKFYQYNQGVTWEKSDLREWLNNSFYNSAFSINEKKIIFKAYLTDTRYSIWNVEPGPATYDYVFCLSNNEIETNLKDYSKWRAVPSAYAVARGCKTNADGMATAWWLRTPGWDKTSVCAVRSSDSSIDSVGYYVYREYVGVRPAIWLDTRIFS